MFVLPAAADCSLVNAVVESDIDTGHGEKHFEHEEEQSGHEEDRAEHEGEEHSEEVHGEFVTSYGFDCANPEHLQQVEVGLFEAFPKVEEIEVQILTGSGQIGTELTPGNQILAW